MYMKKAKIIIITCILLSLTSVTLVFADSPTASFSNCQVILPQSVKPNQNGIDVVLHLDHAKDYDEIRKAIDAGYSSVMFDGSSLPL